MTIAIKATVHIEGQQDLRALVDDLQELERFDQSTFSFKLHTEGAPAPLFLQNVRARPIHDIVREVLARSDAVRSSWYRSPPRGQPFPERVRAGTASLRSQQRELGPVAVWCRTFDSIMCSKGDELWAQEERMNSARMQYELR